MIPVSRRINKTSHSIVENSDDYPNFNSILKLSREDIEIRNKIFEELYANQVLKTENLEKKKIKITLPNNTVIEGESHVTKPIEILAMTKMGNVENVLVAKVTSSSCKKFHCIASLESNADDTVVKDDSSELWDLTRPLEFDCSVDFLDFNSQEGEQVFWHSSAHLLGYAMENLYGVHLNIGPPLERGFYYDGYFPNEMVISQDNYTEIQETVMKLSKKKFHFDRLVLTKDEALKVFQHNQLKVYLIKNKIKENSLVSAYRCGDYVDLCCGPHIFSTSQIKSFLIEKHSASKFVKEDTSNILQRIYGISFPSHQLMKEYNQMVTDAKKRDHRLLGNSLNLFFFESNISPGSCFWLPDGTKLYNRLLEFLKNEYKLRGYQEVITPNIYSCDLFRISGHYQNYKENMYCFNVEDKEWAMKPMNCPGHCLMFKHMNLSYKQLPIRLADFGILHRNEISGSLSGLFRVRRFQQDDAHIFCRQDQIKEEVRNALNFLFFVYDSFGFKFEIKLSTRPTKSLGDEQDWIIAENELKNALDSMNKPWTLNPGDGAFYGPKIDIRIQDAMKRWHQCATIQLDFQLPLQFNLQYRTDEITNTTSDTVNDSGNLNKDDVEKQNHLTLNNILKKGFERPVMIHRAILGSIERMIAILVEHTNAKLPFWLSPRQVIICPISSKNLEYSNYVCRILKSQGYEASINDSNSTINKKIREAQLQKWNFIAVLGQAEEDTKTVSLRDRDMPGSNNILSIQELLNYLKKFKMPSSATYDEVVC